MFEIGNSLREARVRQQLELGEVELATKIRSRYLRALEEESFDALPAQTYVKGFLRTYADYLGLDGQLYVDEFNSRFTIDGDEPREPVVARRTSNVNRHHRRLERRWIAFALAGIAALLVFFIAAWKSGGKPDEQIPNLVTTNTRAKTEGAAARDSDQAHPDPAGLVPPLRARGERQLLDGRAQLVVCRQAALHGHGRGRAVAALRGSAAVGQPRQPGSLAVVYNGKVVHAQVRLGTSTPRTASRASRLSRPRGLSNLIATYTSPGLCGSNLTSAAGQGVVLGSGRRP